MHAQASRYLENNVGEVVWSKGVEQVQVQPRTKLGEKKHQEKKLCGKDQRRGKKSEQNL